MDQRTAIIVLGARRPLALRNTLESLRRQGAIGNVRIWLDGHQGLADKLDPAYQCRAEASKFPEARLVAYNGHVGIEKLMLDALRSTATEIERLIVLEDDCFPTSSAIETFERELDLISAQPEIYSVYGHHFLMPEEGETITRFQGWGWATTRHKLLPVLSRLENCFMLPEPEFLAWLDQQLTGDVCARLAVTPPRNPVDTIRMFFCWDACTAVITASMGLRHKRTGRRVIYNCGVGPDSGHFLDPERFRNPPFNMISPEEVWSVFND